MALARWLLVGAGSFVGFAVGSCGGVQRGEPVPCEHDADCADGFICEGTLGRVCTQAIACSGDSQCPVGASCIERSSAAPDSPFEGEHPERHVCDCLGECASGGFNAGGAAEGGQGGEPKGGAGGAPLGGSGGQGGEPAGGGGGAGDPR